MDAKNEKPEKRFEMKFEELHETIKDITVDELVKYITGVDDVTRERLIEHVIVTMHHFSMDEHSCTRCHHFKIWGHEYSQYFECNKNKCINSDYIHKNRCLMFEKMELSTCPACKQDAIEKILIWVPKWYYNEHLPATGYICKSCGKEFELKDNVFVPYVYIENYM